MAFKSKKKHYDKAGQPMKYQTVEELQKDIDLYFNECDSHTEKVTRKYKKIVGDAVVEFEEIIDESRPLIPSIAGLAYHIGVSRLTLYNYSESEKFFNTIKRARDKILGNIENALLNSENPSAGKIFLAKNYGYTDKTEQEVTFGSTEETKKKLKEIFESRK